jgi:hypothetical protein
VWPPQTPLALRLTPDGVTFVHPDPPLGDVDVFVSEKAAEPETPETVPVTV